MQTPTTNNRYEAEFGPNTKQWWLYDTETKELCDPPISVLERVTALNNMETADDVEAQRDLLEQLANADNNWIADKNYRYNGGMEI